MRKKVKSDAAFNDDYNDFLNWLITRVHKKLLSNTPNKRMSLEVILFEKTCYTININFCEHKQNKTRGYCLFKDRVIFVKVYYKEKMSNESLIFLLAEIRDTLRHEIQHALQYKYRNTYTNTILDDLNDAYDYNYLLFPHEIDAYCHGFMAKYNYINNHFEYKIEDIIKDQLKKYTELTIVQKNIVYGEYVKFINKRF